MEDAQRAPGTAEQALRLVLLLLLWGMWLLVRAAWGLAAEAAAVHARSLLRRLVSWGLLAAVMLVSPHVVGLWWSRALLSDAAHLAAARSDGRDAADIEAALRRRAHKLGFHSLFLQPDAVRIRKEDREGGPFCRVVLDFQHQPVVYGWTLPPLRIHVTGEAYVVPIRDANPLQDLLE